MNYVNFHTFTHTQQSGLDILYKSHLILKFLRVMNEPSALASALLLMLTDVNYDGSPIVLSHCNLKFSCRELDIVD